jgi:dimethylargininase
MLAAFTRAVSPGLADCELTFLDRSPIDVQKAAAQQRDYEETLRRLGVRRIARLASKPETPDSVFIEDTAVVLDELAVITRPGVASRRAETAGVAEALSPHRPLEFIRAPASLEGGDVLRVDRTLYVGLGARTNLAGIDRLRAIVEPYGYHVKAVETHGCLHLKTACSYLGRQTILVNRRWINTRELTRFDLIDIHEAEPWAANAMVLGDAVLIADGFPRTRASLEEHGFVVHTTNISELQKAEAGVTCLSVVFNSD